MQCLDYFARCSKLGSFNAKPVHALMLAMKRPSRRSFTKAIVACDVADMVHLKAMAEERFANFLMKENDASLATEYMTSAFWHYQDWGADAKSLDLLNKYDFLKVS